VLSKGGNPDAEHAPLTHFSEATDPADALSLQSESSRRAVPEESAEAF
jgi:hypothetical protein